MNAEAREFWQGRCLDCAHPEHPLATCHEIVGGGPPSNGPEYCPCAAEMEHMEQEIVALRRATTPPEPSVSVKALRQEFLRRVRESLVEEQAIYVGQLFGWSVDAVLDASRRAALAAEYAALVANSQRQPDGAV